MIFIGKKPEKPSVAKIALAISGIILGTAAVLFAAYQLYKKFVPACIDCECEDFLDDEDFFDDEDDIEVCCEDAAEDTADDEIAF